MKIRKIKQSVYHIYDCAYPLGNIELCARIKNSNVDSLLVLQEDDGPFASLRANGLWSYKRPVHDLHRLTLPEKFRINDFIRYEIRNDRSVGVYIKSTGTFDIDRLFTQLNETRDFERPFPDDEQCCRPFRQGCKGNVVCHATTYENFVKIAREKKLKSKVILCGSGDAEYSKKENLGDPEDFLRYVMFANGDCVAPEFVVESRRRRKFLFPGEVVKNFFPGARLFYETKKLFALESKEFDGIHPVKIRDEHELMNGLVLIAMPGYDKLGNKMEYERNADADVADMIEYFDNRGLTIPEWCNMIYERALQLL